MSHWSELGISEVGVRMIFNSWAKSSIVQYNCALRKWKSYNDKISADPMIINEVKILNFLAELSGNLSHASLIVCRAAISMYAKMTGIQLGNMILVERFMKGVFRVNPSKPRYECIWSVSDVLNHLLSYGPNNAMSIKRLTLKCAMLCALVSPKRVSELAKLNIDSLSIRNDSFLFVIDGMTKNRKIGGKAHTALFNRFPHNQLLCPVATISDYLSATCLCRADERTLFISFNRPYKAISSTTIARWIREVLTEAGIEGYGAHSTRAASTSHASSKGVSSSQILAAACWSSTGSTFEKFYKKDLGNNNAYQNAILSSVALN